MSNYDCKGCKHRTNHTDEGFKFCSGCDRSYLGADSGYHADRYEKEEAEMSMTESEAIEVFRGLLDVPCEMLVKYASVTTEEQKKALVRIRCAEEMAIYALSEIQQYRAIGTVERLSKLNERFKKAKSLLFDEQKMRRTYEAIGTVSEFKQLKEKATAKKPTDTFVFSPCPKCGSRESLGDGFCYNCGAERGL